MTLVQGRRPLPAVSRGQGSGSPGGAFPGVSAGSAPSPAHTPLVPRWTRLLPCTPQPGGLSPPHPCAPGRRWPPSAWRNERRPRGLRGPPQSWAATEALLSNHRVILHTCAWLPGVHTPPSSWPDEILPRGVGLPPGQRHPRTHPFFLFILIYLKKLFLMFIYFGDRERDRV